MLDLVDTESVSSEVLRQNLLADHADWFLIAKDDDLTRVFDGMKPAARQFSFEPGAPHIAFHVRCSAPDNTARCGGFRGKEMQQPAFCAEMSVKLCHRATVRDSG